MNVAMKVTLDSDNNRITILDPDGAVFIFNYDFYFSDEESSSSPKSRYVSKKTSILFFNFNLNRLLVFNYWGTARSVNYWISNFQVINDLPCSNIFPKNLLNDYQFEEQFRSRYASYLLDREINS